MINAFWLVVVFCWFVKIGTKVYILEQRRLLSMCVTRPNPRYFSAREASERSNIGAVDV